MSEVCTLLVEKMLQNIFVSVGIRILKALKFSGGKLWLCSTGFFSYNIPGRRYRSDSTRSSYRNRSHFKDLPRDRKTRKYSISNPHRKKRVAIRRRRRHQEIQKRPMITIDRGICFGWAGVPHSSLSPGRLLKIICWKGKSSSSFCCNKGLGEPTYNK